MTGRAEVGRWIRRGIDRAVFVALVVALVLLITCGCGDRAAADPLYCCACLTSFDECVSVPYLDCVEDMGAGVGLNPEQWCRDSCATMCGGW